MSQYLINSFLLEPFSSPHEHYFHAFIALGWALTFATALGWCLQNSELLVWLESFCMGLLPVTPSASVSCRLVSELCLQLSSFTFPLISLFAESSHRGKGCHTYYIYQNYELFITARFKGSSVISPTASQKSWSLQSKTLLLGEVFLSGNSRRSWAWEGQMEFLDLIW